jgi:hypothetical protein
VKSAAEMVLSHLSQASDAKLAIDQGEDSQHDRTPLFDQGRLFLLTITSGRLRRPRKMAS